MAGIVTVEWSLYVFLMTIVFAENPLLTRKGHLSYTSLPMCSCMLYVICGSSSGADSGSTCWEEGSGSQEGDPERHGS